MDTVVRRESAQIIPFPVRGQPRPGTAVRVPPHWS
jgi:hypothetical protein